MFFSRQKATLPRQKFFSRQKSSFPAKKQRCRDNSFFLEKSLREAYIKANLLHHILQESLSAFVNIFGNNWRKYVLSTDTCVVTQK
jgi:hypothetical protein